jgi:hypothetical protein
MKDEWLIYRNPAGELSYTTDREYDRWAAHVTKNDTQKYPVVARGLTKSQAKQLIQLTKEPK